MLFRRITENVKSQNWFAVFIDFVIVVVGVFVGLQVTSWNDQRIAHARAETYYQRLVTDLNEELKTRAARIDYYEKTKGHAEAVLAALESPEPPDARQLLIDIYQSTQRWTYSPQRTTYDELIAAGIADAIPDATIRTQLANVYVSLEQSTLAQQEPMPFRDELRRHLLHEVQSAIRNECNDQFSFSAEGGTYMSLPDTCNVRFPDDVVRKAMASLTEYEDLVKDLSRHIAILDSKLNSLRANLMPIRAMIATLSDNPGVL